MKSFFKRSAISVVVLGMAGSVYAATPSNNSSSWCPHVTGAFIGVEGLDLRPQNGDLDYVTVYPASTATSGSFNNNAVSTSYHWGWRIYGGLKVTENDDLTLSWMQLNTSQNDGIGLDGITQQASPRWLSSFANTFNWTSVNGHATFDLDDAYAVWGHTIYFNNPWSVRFAGGLEWAKVNSDLTVTADSNEDPGVIGFESKSRMKGFGPRFEMDMTYHLPYGFALFGNANAALLVATRDISLNPTNTTQTDIDFFSNGYSDRHVVVPKFGARLGVSYSYTWGQAGGEGCRTTTLMVDAGWQVESYIHAIERPNDPGFNGIVDLVQSQTNGTFADTKVSNFGDSGLFIGIQLGTDWV
jgi:hypothetical protein